MTHVRRLVFPFLMFLAVGCGDDDASGMGGVGGEDLIVDGSIVETLAACESSCDCLAPEVQEECRMECDTPVAVAASAGCLPEEQAFWECFGEIRCGGVGCGAETNARRSCLDPGGTGGTGGTSGVQGSIDDNNYAQLSGPAVGPGLEDPADVRKTVPVTVVTANPDIEVDDTAFVFRRRSDVEGIRWLVTVTNRSGARQCSIALEEIFFRDSDGTAIADSSIDFVDGNVGVTSTGRWRDSCLDPGASGVVLGIETDDLFSELGSIQVGDVSTRPTTADAPPAVVRATSYRTESVDSFTVVVENTGTASAYIDDTSVFVLLDDSNDPLWWSFLDGEVEIDPGATAELTEGNLLYDGVSSSIDVYVSFEEEP